MQRVRLIPFVCGAGGSTPGAEGGPSALKRAGLAEKLVAGGIDASWDEDPDILYDSTTWGRDFHGHLPPLGDTARRDAVLWHCRHLRDRVAAAVEGGFFPVTVGGDHTMALGSLSGLAQAHKAHGRTGVIWIDAHPDINTPETSQTQAYHGMPVAALLGIGDADFVALGGGRPILKPENIAYLGLRDVDPPEAKYMGDNGIVSYDMRAIASLGAPEAFSRAMAEISGRTDYMALSIDLDAFDPGETPAVGTPVPGGIRGGDLFPAMAHIAERIDLLEIVEYNPSLPGAAQTAEFTCDLLRLLLEPAGRRRAGSL